MSSLVSFLSGWASAFRFVFPASLYLHSAASLSHLCGEHRGQLLNARKEVNLALPLGGGRGGRSGNGWWHCLYDTISIFWEEAPEIFIRFSKVPVPKIGLNCGLYSFSQFLRALHHLRGCEGIFRASLHLYFSTCRNCGEGGGKATIGVLAVSRKGCSGWSGQSCPTLGAPVFLIQPGPLWDISPLSTSSFLFVKCMFGQENTT